MAPGSVGGAPTTRQVPPLAAAGVVGGAYGQVLELTVDHFLSWLLSRLEGMGVKRATSVAAREEPGQRSGPAGVAVPRSRQVRVKEVRVERDVVLKPRREQKRQAVRQTYLIQP